MQIMFRIAPNGAGVLAMQMIDGQGLVKEVEDADEFLHGREPGWYDEDGVYVCPLVGGDKHPFSEFNEATYQSTREALPGHDAYNPEQVRVPKGGPGGGRWAGRAEGGSSAKSGGTRERGGREGSKGPRVLKPAKNAEARETEAKTMVANYAARLKAAGLNGKKFGDIIGEMRTNRKVTKAILTAVIGSYDVAKGLVTTKGTRERMFTELGSTFAREVRFQGHLRESQKPNWAKMGFKNEKEADRWVTRMFRGRDSFQQLVDWDPEQPRVPKGSPGGGQFAGGGTGGAAGALYQRTRENVTADDIIARHQGMNAKIREVEDRLAHLGDDTQARYSVDGLYTDERQEVQYAILQKMFSDPEALAKMKPGEGEQPTLVILGGRGGSGKTWFTTSEDSPLGMEPGAYFYLNSDDIKEKLPEWEGWNANELYREGRDIALTAEYIARDMGLNVVVDATMRQGGPGTSVDSTIHDFEDAGYNIEGHYMHTAPQVAAERSLGRFERTGRYVPPSIILDSTTNEETFDNYSPKFSKWSIYDNNTPAGPVLVAKGGH